MKTKKLVLTKSTIANLNDTHMGNAKAGAIPTVSCGCTVEVCPVVTVYGDKTCPSWTTCPPDDSIHICSREIC